MTIEMVLVDHNNQAHQQDFIMLLEAYALDPMGGGEPLSPKVKANLSKTLAHKTNVFSFICYVDHSPAGLINCVEGFSTFNCQPLVNIHDVVVLKEYRQQGIAQHLFEQVEQTAIEMGCCKVTLEVLQGNIAAQKAYEKFGYQGYELDPKMGQAIFWQKKLN